MTATKTTAAQNMNTARKYLAKVVAISVAHNDLRTAKRVMELMESLNIVEAQSASEPGSSMDILYGLTTEERNLAAAVPSTLIPAIKAIRTRTGLGLKESKDLVETYRARIGWVDGESFAKRQAGY